MNDSRLGQANALLADAQQTIKSLADELPASADRTKLVDAKYRVAAARNLLREVSQ